MSVTVLLKIKSNTMSFTGLRSCRKGKKMECIFENRTGTKVALFRIDEHGKPKLVEKMKDGKKEKADIEEGEVFFAVGKKKKKRRAMINNNTVFTVMADSDGDDKVRAVISNGPGKKYYCHLLSIEL